jgi:hypothetical protein
MSALVVALAAGCASTSHAAPRQTSPAPAAIPAGYHLARTVRTVDNITVEVDGLPYVVPAGHYVGEYAGAQVLEGGGGPYLWVHRRLVQLLPLCAADPSIGGC